MPGPGSGFGAPGKADGFVTLTFTPSVEPVPVELIFTG